MEIKINQLYFSNPRKTNNLAQVFVSLPAEHLKEKLGQLAVIIKIDFSGSSAYDFVSFKNWTEALIYFIRTSYYSPISTLDIEKNFENLASETNKWLEKEMTEGDYQLNIGLLLLKEQSIYFTYFGDLINFLIEENKISNLIAEAPLETKKFTNIVSGFLEEKDSLIIASKNLLDYLSEEKLKKSFEEIKNALIPLKEKITLAMLYLSSSSEEAIRPLPAIDTTIQKAKPEAAKAPISSYKIISELFSKVKAPFEKPKRTALYNLLIKIVYPIKRGLVILGRLTGLNKFNTLPHLTRSLIIICFILAILFTQSIVVLTRQTFEDRAKRKHEEILNQIEASQNELTIALLNNERPEIGKLFTELEELLEKMPKKLEAHQKSYQSLSQEIKSRKNEFYKINLAADYETISPVKNFPSIEIEGIAKSQDRLYFFDSKNNFIYSADLDNKKINLVNNKSINIGHLKKLFNYDNDFLIGFDSKDKLVSFNTLKNELENLELTSPGEIKIRDIAFYQGRLYLLSPLSNQILKYSKTISGFADEISWLNKNENVKDGISLVIDGSLYVLKSSGQVDKYYKGTKIDFSLEEIRPLIKNPTKIYATPESLYFYLLEPSEKRLVIFDKNGKLIKQFFNPEFDDLKDFAISEKEDLAYLLNEREIFIIKTR